MDAERLRRELVDYVAEVDDLLDKPADQTGTGNIDLGRAYLRGERAAALWALRLIEADMLNAGKRRPKHRGR